MINLKHLFSEHNYYYSRILQELAFRTGGAFGRPSGVISILTNHCNARCVHCRSWELPHINNEMTIDEWKNTFYELRRWLGPVFLSITGGETLIKEGAIELAEYAANLGFRVEYLTNGYVMDTDKAEKLVRSGVKRITISIDGSNPQIHEKVRGRKGFFEKATKALKMLVDEKERQRRDMEIWGKTTIMSINVEDLPNIVLLAQKIGITGVKFQSIEPIYYSEQQGNPEWYKDNPLWINNLDILSQSIQRLRELKTKDYPIINTIENLNIIEDYFHNPEKLAYKIFSQDFNKKPKECRDWIGSLQIMPDGGLKMCHWMKPFANAKDGSIHKAWKNRARCWKSPCPYILNKC